MHGNITWAVQVINLDGQARVSYRLEADLINNQNALVAAEQQALANIFQQCAPCDRVCLGFPSP